MKKFSTLLIMYEHYPINKFDSTDLERKLVEKVDAELKKLLGPRLPMINPSEALVKRILEIAKTKL
jgi:hypothetical protein